MNYNLNIKKTMKKSLFILLLVSSIAYSQNVTKKETINKLLLGKTWKAEYGIMNGLKIEKLGQIKSIECTFKADKTYLFNKDKTGTWEYNAKKKCIELFMNGALRSTITTLKNKEIVMTVNPDKEMPKGVKDLQIFFKPKA
jgi:hypothetical protein